MQTQCHPADMARSIERLYADGPSLPWGPLLQMAQADFRYFDAEFAPTDVADRFGAKDMAFLPPQSEHPDNASKDVLQLFAEPNRLRSIRIYLLGEDAAK